MTHLDPRWLLAWLLLGFAAACAAHDTGYTPDEGGGPPHRCYMIENRETCEADPECESSWVQPLEQRELVWECAPRGDGR